MVPTTHLQGMVTRTKVINTDFSGTFLKLMMMKTTHFLWVTCLALVTTISARAQDVSVQNAWARATVQGQKATGAFMTLTSATGARLVSASSPMAGVTEIHEMKLEGDVMKMRAVQGGLALPAGKPVDLKPGGYHVMLMDLKHSLSQEMVVPLTLVFQNAKGQDTRLELKLPVGTLPSAKSDGHGASDAGKHGKH